MEKNTTELLSKERIRFERGITHNLTLINHCLNHLSYELTSDMSDPASPELKPERDDKETDFQGLEKKGQSSSWKNH